MRALPARRTAASALCAALLIGIAAPAAMAADRAPVREQRVQTAAHAPVPGADALLAQVQSLGDLGSVLSPVTGLLNTVLKADNGQLPAPDAASLGKAVTDAISKATTAASPAASTTPATPVTPAAPALPATPPLPLPTLAKSQGHAKVRAAAADVTSDALAALQTAVDTLLKAVTSGDVSQVVPAVTGVVTGLVNSLAATLVGGGLPAPSLSGLPPLPSLPAATPSLPATTPALPAV